MKTSATGVSEINRKASRTSIGLRDKTTQAVINKLIRPRATAGNPATAGTTIPTALELNPIMRDTMQRAFDADRILEVLPDLEQVAQIAIASILSTKDLITTTLIYDCDSSSIPIELRAEMLKVVRKYLDEDYKLPTELYDVLYEVMFRTGSYPVAILPEASIDQLINGAVHGKVGLEALSGDITQKIQDCLKPLGILGSSTEQAASKTSFGIEALSFVGTGMLSDGDVFEPIAKPKELDDSKPNPFGSIKIIDNPSILKLPNLRRNMVASKVSSAYNVAVESDSASTMVSSKLTPVDEGDKHKTSKDADYFDMSMYKNPNYRQSTVAQIYSAEDAERVSVGHPLVQYMPSEAVIPVHVPGNFKQHVGYLVLIDQVGNPISRFDLGNSTEAWSWINGTASSQLIKDAADGLGIQTDGSREDWTISKINNAYSRIVEAKLVQSLRNGVYGDSVTVARPQEVYSIMMARSLAGRSTQILYIPVEQMVYFALDYNDKGIGRSLTDKTRMVGTIRSALMFATMQASVLNATRNMEYTITLDANDREPQSTIEKIQYRITQGYAGRIPFTGNVEDVQAYMTNAGISFNIEGNDYYPSTKISVADNTPDYKYPDRDAVEEQARRHYRGFGIDPDLILTPQNIELATQIISKDLIATKQTCKTQEKLAPLLTHFVKVYTISSGIVMQELYDVVKDFVTPSEEEQDVLHDEEVGLDEVEEARTEDVVDDKKEKEKDFKEGEIGRYINDFLANLTAQLPPPDMSLMASQMDAYEIHATGIDRMLEVWMDDASFTSAMGGAEIFDVARIRDVIGNHLKRNWLRTNQVDPDLIELFDNEEKRDEFVTTIADEIVRIATFGARLQKRIDKRLETVNKNEGNGGGDDAGGFGGGFGDDTSGGFGEDTDSFGDDTFGDDEAGDGLDDDMDLDDNLDEPQEEEENEEDAEVEEEPAEEEPQEEEEDLSDFEDPEDVDLDSDLDEDKK